MGKNAPSKCKLTRGGDGGSSNVRQKWWKWDSERNIQHLREKQPEFLHGKKRELATNCTLTEKENRKGRGRVKGNL